MLMLVVYFLSTVKKNEKEENVLVYFMFVSYYLLGVDNTFYKMKITKWTLKN